MEYNNYILIGNFGLDYDALRHKFLDASTDHSFRDFFERVTSITESLGLELVEFFDDALVVRGDFQDVEYIEKYFGNVYSCARPDEGSLKSVRACEHDNYIEPKPGAQEFIGHHSSSEIELRKPKKALIKYDA